MISEIIKEYRMNLKVSQEEMAFMLGISSNHLSRIELKKTHPSGALINKVFSIISQDKRVLSMTFENTKIYGLVLMLRMNELNDSKRKFVFQEGIKIIDIISKLP